MVLIRRNILRRILKVMRVLFLLVPLLIEKKAGTEILTAEAADMTATIAFFTDLTVRVLFVLVHLVKLLLMFFFFLLRVKVVQ